MSENFYKTVENARVYYEKISHSCAGEKFEGSGFIAIIHTKNRTYYVDTQIDSDSNLVMMNIAPGIYSSPASRSMVGEYIAKINESFKSCTLHIEDNGTIYIKAEQHFADAPVSTMSFRRMEFDCIKILDAFAAVIEKVANMKLLTPEEADVEKVYDEHIKKVINYIRDKFMESDNEDDNGKDKDKEYEEIDRETEEKLIAEIDEIFNEYESETVEPVPKEKRPGKNRRVSRIKHSDEKEESLPEKADFDSIVNVESDEDAT